MPWVQLGIREPQSSSAHQYQSQTELGALSSEQMAQKTVHTDPQVPLLVRGLSSPSVPIDTFLGFGLMAAGMSGFLPFPNCPYQ